MRRKIGNIKIWNEGNVFFVIGENGETYEFINAAEARERFLGELDRVCRKVVNEDLTMEGYDVITGGRIAVDCNNGA